MNIAYLISAHTDPQQLKRLIDALHPDAEFFIHIDAKTNIAPFKQLISGNNIHFSEQRLDVRWGTMIEVEYQMLLLRQAVQHGRTFDRIFFLSGMDYPLWTPERISAWLQEQGDREILQGVNMNTDYISAQQRELYSLPRPLFRVFSTEWNQRLSIACRKVCKIAGIRKQLRFNVGYETWNLYKGSAWWCISESLARYILDVYDNKPIVRRYFSSSFGQAETMIQTIAFNSPLWAGKCMLHKGTYPGLAVLTPLHFIDYNPVIKIMEESDYDRLMASGKMFCRKVVSGRSDKLIALLKE